MGLGNAAAGVSGAAPGRHRNRHTEASFMQPRSLDSPLCLGGAMVAVYAHAQLVSVVQARDAE